MATYTPTLPLDLTGKSPTNLIVDEEHILIKVNRRLVLPKYGSFFREGLIIKDQVTNKVLTTSQYFLTEFYQDAALLSAKNVFNTIVVMDRNVEGPIMLTYQALGGPYSRHKQELLAWFNTFAQSTNPGDWSDVEEKPYRYPVAHHKQHSEDLYGAEYLRDQLDSLMQAISVDTSTPKNDYLQEVSKRLKTALDEADMTTSIEIVKHYNKSFKTLSRTSVGLSQIPRYPVMSNQTVISLSQPHYDPASGTPLPDELLTLNGLRLFSKLLEEKLVNTTTTNISKVDTPYKNSTKASLLSAVNGELFALRSRAYLDARDIDYEKDVYPIDSEDNEEIYIVRISSTDTNQGGIWLAYSSNQAFMYLLALPNDMCFLPVKWNKVLMNGDLKPLLDLIDIHAKDRNNPHKVNQRHVKLGKVENLPVVTPEDMADNDVGMRKYVTLDTLMYYTDKYLKDMPPPPFDDGKPDLDRRLMSDDAIIFTECRDCLSDPRHPSKGQLVKTWCEGTDRFARYTDGNGGFEDQVLQLNSDDCKYYAMPKEGTVLGVFCEGTNKKSTVADGKGKTYDVVTEFKSKDCGYVDPLSAGTVIAEFCQGADKMKRYADGENNTYDMVIEKDSEDCGYEKPPETGRVLAEFCNGPNMMKRFADGKGSYNDVVVAVNSEECGYVKPNRPLPKGTVISTSCLGVDELTTYADGEDGEYTEISATKSEKCGFKTPPPKGTIVSFRCEGTTGYTKFSDGEGGETEEVTSINSIRCGGKPPPPPAPPPDPNAPPPAPPEKGKLIEKFCKDIAQWGKYHDGEGGTYDEVINEKSEECGYVPPIPRGTLLREKCLGFSNIGIYADGNYGEYEDTIETNSVKCGYVPPPPPPPPNDNYITIAFDNPAMAVITSATSDRLSQNYGTEQRTLHKVKGQFKALDPVAYPYLRYFSIRYNGMGAKLLFTGREDWNLYPGPKPDVPKPNELFLSSLFDTKTQKVTGTDGDSNWTRKFVDYIEPLAKNAFPDFYVPPYNFGSIHSNLYRPTIEWVTRQINPDGTFDLVYFTYDGAYKPPAPDFGGGGA